MIEYKNAGTAEHPDAGSLTLSEHFVPLGLTEEEMDQLEDFVLNGLNDPHLERYVPTVLPSGNCFPNNDPQSRADLGCN
ncbi:MAG TPA: hypothetical protein DCE41_35135 [Cytophagales bacterium]|nr:hypothetical protein [Cytophagales bacterium]